MLHNEHKEDNMNYSKGFHISEEMVEHFAHAVNDFNPVHLDKEYASTTRFKRPIAHGELLGGLISGMLVEQYGEGTIYVSTHLKFTNPVFVGSEVTIALTTQPPSETKFTNVGILVMNEFGDVAITGVAEIIPGKKVS